jgi:hypothetical protein
MSLHLDKLQPKNLEQKINQLLANVLLILRYFFIALMIVYTAICVVIFAIKLSDVTLIQGDLSFKSIDTLLTDGLFVLIILAIVKSLFLKNSFDYVIMLLETGFVVLIRKVILLQTHPNEWLVLLVLGITSAVFFLLIILTHYLKHQWRMESEAKKNVAIDSA